MSEKRLDLEIPSVDDLFKVSDDNKNKIVKYFEELGYKVLVKEYGISNKKFLNLLDNYDNTLKSTNDKTAISSIINQVLVKYEEVVINGNTN